jgi:hypothetical protein
MPKKGSKRAKKFATKHDPDLLLLRWKALQNFSKERYYVTAIKHFQLDDNIRTLIDRYILPYGQAGTFMDLVRKLVYTWGYLTDAQKELLKQQWIEKGFPEELFYKIADKYMELQNFITQRPINDMVLSWFAELNPYPQEAYTPQEEDQTIKIETTYETETAKIPPYWKQEGYKVGFLLRKLVNVFGGRDRQLPQIFFNLLSCRIDLGSDLTLVMPTIAIREYEWYGLLDLPNISASWEMPITEIIKTLVIGNMQVEGDINAAWLDMLYIRLQYSNVFPKQASILTNSNAYVSSVYAVPRITTDLTNIIISAQSNSFEGKDLINEFTNPLVEAST